MAEPAEGSTDQANFILAVAFIEGFAHKSYAIKHRLTPESVLVSISSTKKAFIEENYMYACLTKKTLTS